MASLLAVFSSCGSPQSTPSSGRPGAHEEDASRAPLPFAAHGGGALGARALGGAEAVIVVTVDGVRWQEVFGGVDGELARAAGMPRATHVGARDLLPNLYRSFFDDGAVLGAPDEGEGIAASGPRYVSLPAYLELMTAAPATCWSNDCDPVVGWTVAEALAGGGREAAAVYASWDRIGDVFRDARAVAVHAGRAQDDHGPSYPGQGRYRTDRVTARLAIEHLVRHRPRFLWIALGDTDEWAHRGDYRGYLEAMRFADAFVGELVAHLAEMAGYGEKTTLFVTTDHGRDENFADHGGKASARVWLMARGAGIPNRGVVASPTRRHLRDVAPTVMELLHVPVERCSECGAPIDELLSQPPE
jgi:hypothetical protein